MKRSKKTRRNQTRLIADIGSIKEPLSISELRNTRIQIQEHDRCIDRYQLTDRVKKFWL
jgi:hypothetical protein